MPDAHLVAQLMLMMLAACLVARARSKFEQPMLMSRLVARDAPLVARLMLMMLA